MRVWTFTLCYNDAEIIKESIDRYYATKDPSVETVHVLVNQHWPISYDGIRETLYDLAKTYGCIVLDPGRNLGLHKGFNWAWSHFQIPDNAMVIGYDCDCYPRESGWDRAMGEIFMARPDIGWLSLWNHLSDSEIIQGNRFSGEEKICGHRVVTMKLPSMNSVCGWRQEWLRKENGIDENREFYGGVEEVMFPKLQAHNLKWVYLRDFSESFHMHYRENPLYTKWKYEHAHARSTQVDFGTWLKQINA